MAPYSIVVVGTSLGGLEALKVFLGGLGEALPLPVVLVQHQSEQAGGGLRDVLSRYSGRPVEVPHDKMAIRSGITYLAPAGYHLLVERGRFALSVDAPVLYARPSIDVLFESAADAYREEAVGVALTSSSTDGASGMAAIHRQGGFTIVQDPASAVARTLPDAVLACTPVDRVLPLGEIAPFLARLLVPPVRS